MGEIYMITNDINNKIYIGATTRTVHDRCLEYHKKYNNPKTRDYNYKICIAMREIGFEHFIFTTVEYCSNETLEEREKYWIQYYDSINSGYNVALGGKGKPLWTNKQLLACKDLYESGWLLEDLAEIFNSNPKTISKKLRCEYGLNSNINGNIYSKQKPLECVDNNNLTRQFSSRTEAAKWLMDAKLCKGHSITSLCSRINNAIKTNKLMYGMKWKDKI